MIYFVYTFKDISKNLFGTAIEGFNRLNLTKLLVMSKT